MQHQWSVSASEAPKRRGATLGARHNAASTHPLWLILSLSLSLSLAIVLLPFLSAFPFACLSEFSFLRLCQPILPFSPFLCLSLSLDAACPKFAKIFEAPSSLFFPSTPVFQREKAVENFSSNTTPFPHNFYFPFSLAFATTRARRVPYLMPHALPWGDRRAES